MKTILFQGDSITDSGREKSDPKNLGGGYAHLISAHFAETDPFAYTFFNRGVNSNTVRDLHDRLQDDIIALQPDVMSILIGINDVYHAVYTRQDDDLSGFYADFTALMADIAQMLPNTKLLFLEPFILPGELTDPAYDRFFALTEQVAIYEKAYADAHHIPVILLQKQFLDRSAASQPGDWLKDGIHPTLNGHLLIRDAWLQAYAAL